MWSQNLGSVILVDPFKLGIFYGSVILWKRLPQKASLHALGTKQRRTEGESELGSRSRHLMLRAVET